MMIATSSTRLPACAALGALLVAACAGAPDPPLPANPISGPATAEPADGGAPQPAPVDEPSPQPPSAVDPGGATAVESPPPALTPERPPAPAPPATTAPPGSTCEILRAVKSARPLFERPPLPCDRADRLLYYRRGADGACGPWSVLTVAAAGAVTLESAAAGDAPSASAACASPLTARAELGPDEARRLIALSCAALNAGYALERGVGCRTSAVRLFFFEGESKLGETAALPCPPHALDRVVAELEEIVAEID